LKLGRKLLRSYLIPYLLDVLFLQRSTMEYPFGPLVLPQSYRGALDIDMTRCVGCGRCARDCPCQALDVSRARDGSVRITHIYAACAECGQCEFSCPREAIHMAPRFRQGTPDREEMVVTWEKAAPEGEE
jgi:hydrogenase-4 component H